MALIFLLSAQPGLRISSDAAVDAPVRHVAHIAVYAVLALLLLRGLGGVRDVTPRTAALAACLALLYGATDELHQATVPDRTGQAIDLIWDALGALLGASVAAGWSRLRRGRP